MTYKKALSIITDKRREALTEATVFYRALMLDNSEFRSAELALRSAELDLAYGKTTSDKVESLRKKRDSVIAKLNVADKLAPKPACPICDDTGRVGNRYCSCVKKLAFEQADGLIELPLHSFSEIDFSLFEGDAIAQFRTIAGDLAIICKKGDEAKRKNVNLLGSTGTGKTFLASCMAHEYLEHDKTVVFLTAFSFVSRLLAYHTAKLSDKNEFMLPLIDCDALVIDDLGTESIFKNVTVEYLYSVVNERQIRGKLTVITSNLSIDEIAVRYGERIASRLFDKRLCYTRELSFADIRKLNV